MPVTITSPTLLAELRAGSRYAPIVIDARPVGEYAGGHIPWAIHMDWADWCEPAPDRASAVLNRPGYWGALAARPPDWYAKRLGSMGISSDRQIIVYADGPRSRGREGRIAWMLLYLGATNVSLLDGGWSGWLASGGEAGTTAPIPDRARFTASIQPHRRRMLSDLIEPDHMDATIMMVDTRSPAEFEGRAYSYQPRMGRLPSAVMVPFADLFQPSGTYLDDDMYRRRISEKVRAASHLVAYCEVGVRACSFALLHEIHTGAIVPVYDGSIVEWGLHPELPMTGRHDDVASLPARRTSVL